MARAQRQAGAEARAGAGGRFLPDKVTIRDAKATVSAPKATGLRERRRKGAAR